MINQAELLAKYQDKMTNYYLVDVRTSYEYEDHHLPESVNIPIDNLERELNQLPKDKHIITVCEHGVRSGIAEKFLRSKGFQADSLENGLCQWTGAMEKGKGKL